MPRTGLCRHCNRIRLGLQKLEREAQKFIVEYGDLPPRLDFDLRTQRQMAEDARWEGCRYGSLFDDDFIGTKLEDEFRFLSKQLTGCDLFFGLTSALNYSFSQNQRRFLFYLLSLMSRGIVRKHRRTRGMGLPTRGELP